MNVLPKFKVKQRHDFIQIKRDLINSLKGEIVEIKHADKNPIPKKSLPNYFDGKIIGLTKKDLFFKIKTKEEEKTLSLFGLISILELKQIN